jgi:hypothetical protein
VTVATITIELFPVAELAGVGDIVGADDGADVGAADGAGDDAHCGIKLTIDSGTTEQKADPSAHPGPVGSPPHGPIHDVACSGNKAQYDGVDADAGASVVVPVSHPNKEAYSAGTTLQKSNAWHSAVVGSPPHSSIHPTISGGNVPHACSIVTSWASTGASDATTRTAVAAKKLESDNIMI